MTETNSNTQSAGQPPPVGGHVCQCISAERWSSPKKGTPAIMLTWKTADGAFMFEDPLYITARAMWRLSLAAQHVGGMSEGTDLPEDNMDAAEWCAAYMEENAPGRSALVTIVQSGKYRKVAGAGYGPVPAAGAVAEQDIPF